MTNLSLAQSYLSKAKVRLTILPVLFEADAYSDVIREAQEIVELALKGMLRQAGIEPPHWHDVGGMLKEHAERFPTISAEAMERLVRVSAWLRKEREFAFYGDVDFLPTEQYDASTGTRAMQDAQFAVEIAGQVISSV